MSHSEVFYPCMSNRPPFTVEVPGYEDVKGETIPRRNAHHGESLQSRPDETTRTLYDIVRRAGQKFGNARCMGARDLIKVHNETRKVKKTVNGREVEVDRQWTYFELSEYRYISFSDYEKLVLQIGAGLRELGLEKGDRVHLYAATSPHWLATMHGASSQSMPVVTSYETLGEDALIYSMIATKAKAIFTDPHLLKSLKKPLAEAKDIEFVIYNTNRQVEQEDLSSLIAEHPRLTFLSFEELRKLGEENPVEPVPPQADDLCCIMYTSGSTGTPKGVTLTHKNIVAAVTGGTSVVGKYIGPGDVLLTYLPLAHIFEFVFENASLYWGSVMGYGNPKTLTDASMRNCKGDIRELKPTLMVGVPAVWESVRKGIIQKIGRLSVVARTMFWASLRLKRWLVDTGFPGSGILDALIFQKVKDATGGRLRFCMTGAGPIAKDTQEFISFVIAPMINGYGLTETSGMAALCDPHNWTSNALGDIPSCVEVKLVDFPDAGYFTKSTPPQGEVWVRGDCVMQGYYENESATAEALAPGGWFQTGDIGEWDANGHLKIIGRKKNLVKTLNGEYIAIEKLESIYRSATVVSNICVYAAPDRTKPVAIVVPAEPALLEIASENGIDDKDLEGLVQDEKIQAIALQSMQALGRKNGLAGIEIIDGVVLVETPWTPQNGLTTAAEKLNRVAILERYRADIERAYARNT